MKLELGTRLWICAIESLPKQPFYNFNASDLALKLFSIDALRCSINSGIFFSQYDMDQKLLIFIESLMSSKSKSVYNTS